MNTRQFLQALDQADDAYIQQAGVAGGHFSRPRTKKKPRVLTRVLIAAVLVMALTATAFAAGEIIGIWNDRWLQTPQSDPVEVVREAISRQREKEYTVSVVVEDLRVDEEETDRILAGDRGSMLARMNGAGAEELSGRDAEDVKAVYARYRVEYDHTKTFYRDGTLYQYFYLVRNGEGKWEIRDSSDPRELNPDVTAAPDPAGIGSEPRGSDVPSDAAAEAPIADERYEAAIRSVREMILKWEEFEDVERVTIDAAAYDPARTEAARSELRGSALAEGNGWTEEYLKNHMAAITVTYTIRYTEPGGAQTTETSTYWLLQDPATGAWRNSEITGLMDGAGQ